jgi:hypothetical protein
VRKHARKVDFPPVLCEERIAVSDARDHHGLGSGAPALLDRLCLRAPLPGRALRRV